MRQRCNNRMEASGFVMSKSQRGEVGVTTSETVVNKGLLARIAYGHVAQSFDNPLT